MKYKWSIYCCCAVLTWLFSACDYIYDDIKPCPSGLYLTFKYDYNLQRADMFSDHVGSVTAYIFDENGNFLLSKTESGDVLKEDDYEMYLDLPPGTYQYIIEALQTPYNEAVAGPGASFIRTVPKVGENMMLLAHTLETRNSEVNHEGLPLDTLWHGIQPRLLEVKPDIITRDTVSLMRNTKEITVSLREIDTPENMDVERYSFRIIDRNQKLSWDNQVDEQSEIIYTPYMTHNTSDRQAAYLPAGRMGHADFMTSRIIYHNRPEDDAVLSITNLETGVEVIHVNLADMLSRLRSAADIYRYSPQEFLDRGYDYHLTFYLKGDQWDYVSVEISTLAWSKRIQNEGL